MKTIGLYIHIPWCAKKCFYCDFNTYQLKKYENIKIHYIKHLIQDLINDTTLIPNKIINTIFIGGGTPSLIHYKLLKILIDNINNLINIDQKLEFTIEINPDLINIYTIFKYIKLGINRISVGIQSFNNNILKYLGRNNSKVTAIKILKQIKKYTNVNLNIDLIYGLPNQTISNCIKDLKTVILLQPHHISWYQLNIEKNTIFYYQKPKLPNEHIIWKMYKKGNKLLRKFKYIRYEISSYTKSKNPCYHNLNYWKFGDYIGIGSGAHGKLTQNNGDIIRTIKKKRIYDYINPNKKYMYKKYIIPKQDKPFEYFINTFRLFQPINKKHFYSCTGLKYNDIKKKINKCIFQGYMIEKKKYWLITNKGRTFLNHLIQNFIIITNK